MWIIITGLIRLQTNVVDLTVVLTVRFNCYHSNVLPHLSIYALQNLQHIFYVQISGAKAPTPPASASSFPCPLENDGRPL